MPRLLCFRPLALGLALAAGGAFGGCSSSATSTVRVMPSHASHAYAQSFPVAYARHNAAGDVDVVMTRDAADMTSPTAGSGLRQVMHVRVLWQPMKGTKTDSPTATNATLSWFVSAPSADARQATRMIEYSGAAFVEVAHGAGQTVLTIRNASLKPAARVGDLTDPIGPARIEGRVVARNDAREVDGVLAETKAALGAAQASARIDRAKAASSRLPAD